MLLSCFYYCISIVGGGRLAGVAEEPAQPLQGDRAPVADLPRDADVLPARGEIMVFIV